jgi:hypothetical protein
MSEWSKEESLNSNTFAHFDVAGVKLLLPPTCPQSLANFGRGAARLEHHL